MSLVITAQIKLGMEGGEDIALPLELDAQLLRAGLLEQLPPALLDPDSDEAKNMLAARLAAKGFLRIIMPQLLARVYGPGNAPAPDRSEDYLRWATLQFVDVLLAGMASQEWLFYAKRNGETGAYRILQAATSPAQQGEGISAPGGSSPEA